MMHFLFALWAFWSLIWSAKHRSWPGAGNHNKSQSIFLFSTIFQPPFSAFPVNPNINSPQGYYLHSESGYLYIWQLGLKLRNHFWYKQTSFFGESQLLPCPIKNMDRQLSMYRTRLGEWFLMQLDCWISFFKCTYHDLRGAVYTYIYIYD